MSLIPYRKSSSCVPAARGGLDEFDRIFDGFFRNALTNLAAPAPSVTQMLVKMDIAETEKAYHVKTELPGLEQKDVELTLEDGILTVSGEKRSESEEEGKTFHRVERSYGRFSRAVQLPGDADEKSIKAHMKHGVLEIEIGKIESARKKAQRIDIKSA